jgi:hypothetical protein
MFKSYKRNAIVTFFTDPFRLVPVALVMYFVIPYLYELGYTNTEIGSLQSLGTGIFAVIAAFFAPAVINRLGRKRATIMFQDLPYILMIVLFYFADKSHAFVFVAYAMMGINRIGNNSYTLLFQEDETDKSRQVVNSYLTFLMMLMGIFYAFFSAPIAEYGLLPVVRWMIIGGAAVMTVNLIIRGITFRETAIGREIKSHPDNKTIFKSLATNIKKYPYMLKNKVYFAIILMFIVNVGGMFMMMLVQPGFLFGKGLVDEPQYAMVSTGTVVTGFLAMFVAIPLITKFKVLDLKVYIMGSLLSVLACILLIFVQPGMFIPTLLLVSLLGFSTFFAFGYCYVIIVNHSKDEDGSDLLGAANFISAFAAMGYPVFYGWLLDKNPDLAMGVCAVVWLLNAVSMYYVLHSERKVNGKNINVNEN